MIFNWKYPVIFRNASEVGRYLKSDLQRKFNSILYSRINKVISVSRTSEKDILSHFPFLKGKTEVIPVGLEEKEDFKPAILKPEERKHIVHIGGFSFEKNHEGLLRIFELIHKKNSGIQLHLIGDGPLRPEIETKVKEYGLEEFITFHGFISKPLPYIKAADILILPSIIEGLPGVLLEGMYCRTPVIAYNVGGISEIISENTGFLIQKDDEVTFAEYTVKILNNPDLERVEEAYKMVKRDFMNKDLALKFVNSYQKLVEQYQ